jgi:hypothetical protein
LTLLRAQCLDMAGEHDLTAAFEAFRWRARAMAAPRLLPAVCCAAPVSWWERRMLLV